MASAFGVPQSAHVIVIGNEKGGSGKSTTGLHIAVALLKAGQRVATIDLDSRQRSLTRYVENRRASRDRGARLLEVPTHHHIARSAAPQPEDNEIAEFSTFNSAFAAVEHTHDFIVIDTPGSDSYLMRLAHSLADTLVTPINDSFVDFDVLGRLAPGTATVLGESHYAEMVRRTRLQREQFEGRGTDWVVLRNRLAPLGSRNKRQMADSLNSLASQLEFRLLDGLQERVVYREFFVRGLTALDDLNAATLGARPTASHAAAREEVRALVEGLRLPLRSRGFDDGT